MENLEKSYQDGKKQGCIDVARQMLKMGMEKYEIISATGLFSNEINRIKAEGLTEDEKNKLFFESLKKITKLEKEVRSIDEFIHKMIINEHK